MAKKQKKTSKSTKPATKIRRAPAATNGPVTLEEAQALVKAQSPKRAPRKTRGAATAASPASIGIERKKLEKQNREENDQRVREYKATLAIMKKRGVKGLKAKTTGAPKRRAPGTTAARPQPLYWPFRAELKGRFTPAHRARLFHAHPSVDTFGLDV